MGRRWTGLESRETTRWKARKGGQGYYRGWRLFLGIPDCWIDEGRIARSGTTKLSSGESTFLSQYLLLHADKQACAICVENEGAMDSMPSLADAQKRVTR